MKPQKQNGKTKPCAATCCAAASVAAAAVHFLTPEVRLSGVVLILAVLLLSLAVLLGIRIIMALMRRVPAL